MMRIDYDESDDILHITFLDGPIVRDVSQTWNVNFGFSETGLAEITILDAKANNYWPIENLERLLVQKTMDDVTAGRLVQMSKAREWADSIGTDHEIAMPESSPRDSAARPREKP